jgi:site-specific DNA recombinase
VIARRAHEQGAAHGRAPLGYRKEGGRMVVDDALAPAVVEVFRRYADGEPINAIATWFSGRRGVLTNRNRIKKVLANDHYRGKVVLHGEVVDGGHPPLIDDDLWQRVQDRLEQDRTIPPRRLNPLYSLTGLVWCAHCQVRANVWPSRRGTDGLIVPRFMCRRKSDGTGACDGFGVPKVADIERWSSPSSPRNSSS